MRTVGTSVNQGPVEMATVFLGPIAEGIEAPTLEHVRLRLNFKEFLRRYELLIQYSILN